MNVIEKFIKGKTFMDWVLLSLLLLIIIGLILYNGFFNQPKNSVQLYEEIALTENMDKVTKLMVDGFEDNFKEEDIRYIQELENTANQIRQITLFEYDEKTFVMSTTVGTKKLEVYEIEELPEDIRNYFADLAP